MKFQGDTETRAGCMQTRYFLSLAACVRSRVGGFVR